MVGWFFYNEPIEAVPSGGFLPAEVPRIVQSLVNALRAEDMANLSLLVYFP